MAEVTFTTWTADRLLHHPSFEGLREDRPAKDVKLEWRRAPPRLELIESRRRTYQISLRWQWSMGESWQAARLYTN